VVRYLRPASWSGYNTGLVMWECAVVRFRTTFVLRDLGFTDGQIAEFATNQPPVVEMEIRQPLRGEENSLTRRECICTVRTEEPVSDKVTGQFEQALKAALEHTGKDPRGLPKEPPTPPPAVREITLRVGHRTSEFARRIAKLIRWRTGFPGEHDPIHSSRGTRWSVDGEDWKIVPGDFQIGLLTSCAYSKPDEAMLGEVKGMLAGDLQEPLAHELLLEAMELQYGNRRSALLIGIAAAEIGMKDFIGKLVPTAEWLAFHTPTPPLVAMLEEFLPTLPAKYRLSGISPFVPKEMLTILRKGVKLRNEATHAGGSITQETLTEVLHTVHDLLYLLDFYGGQQWAIDFVQHHYKDLKSAIENAKK
jgi:hypothetical protein